MGTRIGKITKPHILIHWLQNLAVLLVILCTSLTATAAILIWPTRLTIESGEKATALWLENQGHEVKVMQLRVFAWSQQNGQDQLLEQQAVVGSPPMMRIEPGQRQLIRIINNVQPPAGTEQAYRIILDEIPVNEALNTTPEPQGIRFQLRYSIPLFIYGAGLKGKTADSPLPENPASTLTWQTVQDGQNTWLEIRNHGNTFVHLGKITLLNTAQSSTTPLGDESDLSGYVLAGSSMRWLLTHNASPAYTLTVVIDGRKSATIQHVTSAP